MPFAILVKRAMSFAALYPDALSLSLDRSILEPPFGFGRCASMLRPWCGARVRACVARVLQRRIRGTRRGTSLHRYPGVVEVVDVRFCPMGIPIRLMVCAFP
jgi:hypothetical protein